MIRSNIEPGSLVLATWDDRGASEDPYAIGFYSHFEQFLFFPKRHHLADVVEDFGRVERITDAEAKWLATHPAPETSWRVDPETETIVWTGMIWDWLAEARRELAETADEHHPFALAMPA